MTAARRGLLATRGVGGGCSGAQTNTRAAGGRVADAVGPVTGDVGLRHRGRHRPSDGDRRGAGVSRRRSGDADLRLRPGRTRRGVPICRRRLCDDRARARAARGLCPVRARPAVDADSSRADGERHRALPPWHRARADADPRGDRRAGRRERHGGAQHPHRGGRHRRVPRHRACRTGVRHRSRFHRPVRGFGTVLGSPVRFDGGIAAPFTLGVSRRARFRRQRSPSAAPDKRSILPKKCETRVRVGRSGRYDHVAVAGDDGPADTCADGRRARRDDVGGGVALRRH